MKIVQDYHNYKTLTEIAEVFRNVLCPWIWRLNIAKMLILSKFISGANAMQVICPENIFVEIDELLL